MNRTQLASRRVDGARSTRGANSNRCPMLLLLGAALAVLALRSSVSAQFLTVYGGPTYDQAMGIGYRDKRVPLGVGSVNDSGVVLSWADKIAGGQNVGERAIRWNASGAAAVELGHLGTDSSGVTSSGAYQANAAGAAVGWADRYIGGAFRGERAVRWAASGTAATELDNLGTTNGFTDGRAVDVNDSGVAVGYADRRSNTGWFGPRAVRWAASGTSATELGHLGTSVSGYTESMATAINSAGVTVGDAQKYVGGVALGDRAVRWSAAGTSATELGNLGVDSLGYSYSYAHAINSAGTAVGRAAKYVGGTFAGERAVRWDASGTAAVELDSVSSGFSGAAYAINAAGVAVGVSDRRAARWDASGTAVTELGHISENAEGQAVDINAAGFAVGYAAYYVDADFKHSAVLWKLDASAVDLNMLIEPNCGWTLTYANSIGDSNWVTGIGRFDPDGPGPLHQYDRAFLLNVSSSLVPEPASSLLAIMGLSAVFSNTSPRKAEAARWWSRLRSGNLCFS